MDERAELLAGAAAHAAPILDSNRTRHSASMRFADFGDDTVRIARSLVVRLGNPGGEERLLRSHLGGEWRRGRRSTALIEKDNRKSESSIHRIAVAPATAESPWVSVLLR